MTLNQIIEQQKPSLTYTVSEIAQMLNISTRSAYNLCAARPQFKVLRLGRSLRVNKESFDEWFNK